MVGGAEGCRILAIRLEEENRYRNRTAHPTMCQVKQR